LVSLFSDWQKASQSLCPQTQIEFKLFFPATCASGKTLIGLQTCEQPAASALQQAVSLLPKKALSSLANSKG